MHENQLGPGGLSYQLNILLVLGLVRLQALIRAAADRARGAAR